METCPIDALINFVKMLVVVQSFFAIMVVWLLSGIVKQSQKYLDLKIRQAKGGPDKL